MQRITRDRLTIVFDCRTPPVAHVKPSETFIIETKGARGGRIRTPETTTPQYLIERLRRGGMATPLRAPSASRARGPGHTLAVHIYAQACDTLGWQPIWPLLFHLEDFVDQPRTVPGEIRNGKVIFKRGIQIPGRPMSGIIGTAPHRSDRFRWHGAPR
jgi:amidase